METGCLLGGQDQRDQQRDQPAASRGSGSIPLMSISDLSKSERAWLEADEARWRRAHEIAAQHPGLDVSGVYHVINNLLRTPEQRLRRGLAHGRLRLHPG